MNGTGIIECPVRVGHIFCGLGGGAKGFNKGQARAGNLVAKFECVGGIDSDPAAIRDFGKLAGVPGTVLDLFSLEQYIAFHGRQPPPGWTQAMPADIHRAMGWRRPHIWFLSAPCKGFSGLLPEQAAKTDKYQALNGLTLRGIWLALEAYKDDPVELIVFENVPRIMSRGRYLLDQIVALLRSYGYAVAETKHDCGKIGNLGQSRERFLLVARHQEKVPPFLYEPRQFGLRGCGEIIGRLPVPGPEPLLPMHRVPSLQWKTWVRLAFVEAGSDWRSLNQLAVKDGVLADYGIAPDTDWQGGVLGVNRWEDHSGVVAGRSTPTNGAFSVADPRIDGHHKSVQLGVKAWPQPSGVVSGNMWAGSGPHAVADPRITDRTPFNHVYRIVRWGEASPPIAGPGGAGGAAVQDPRFDWLPTAHQNKMRVVRFGGHAGTITGSDRVGSGAQAVADPRAAGEFEGAGKYGVAGFGDASRAVIGASTTGHGAFAVADPRQAAFRSDRKHYNSGGHYGVMRWGGPANAITGSADIAAGRWAIADPRDPSIPARDGELILPAPNDRLVAMIRALDGTWHRPFTTLELAALQSLVDPEEVLELDGLSDSAWRERIGNAVPPDAAAAIAGVMGRCLLAAWSGQTFMLSSEPIWVQPIAVALSVDVPEGVAA